MLHELVADEIKFSFRQPEQVDRLLDQKFAADGFAFMVSHEHIDAIKWCMEKVRTYISDDDVETHVEVKLPIDAIEPGTTGTCDVILLDFTNRTLYSLDHKFGKGVRVYAEDNPQLIAYAIGAIDKYDLLGEMERVVIGVLQPRLDHHDEAELTIAQVDEWRKRLSDGAKRTHEPNAPLRAGDWCQFCPNKPVCPELHGRALAVARAAYSESQIVDGATMVPLDEVPDIQIREMLDQAPLIRAYLSSLEGEAKRRLQVGLSMSGYKLVFGRGSRQWTSVTELRAWILNEEACNFDFQREIFYKAPAMLNPAQMEKVCKSNDIPFPGAMVTKLSGNVSLVPETDPRPAIALGYEPLTTDESD